MGIPINGVIRFNVELILEGTNNRIFVTWGGGGGDEANNDYYFQFQLIYHNNEVGHPQAAMGVIMELTLGNKISSK